MQIRSMIFLHMTIVYFYEKSTVYYFAIINVDLTPGIIKIYIIFQALFVYVSWYSHMLYHLSVILPSTVTSGSKLVRIFFISLRLCHVHDMDYEYQ